MKTALATLAALLTMAACLAFAEPPTIYGMPATDDNRPTLKLDECYWLAQDATPLPPEMFKQHTGVVQETRTRICYHGWAYTVAVLHRLVNDKGPMTAWAWRPDEEPVWLYIGPGGQTPRVSKPFPYDKGYESADD